MPKERDKSGRFRKNVPPCPADESENVSPVGLDPPPEPYHPDPEHNTYRPERDDEA